MGALIGLLWFLGGVVVTVGVSLIVLHVLTRFKMLRDIEKDTLLEERLSTVERAITQISMMVHRSSDQGAIDTQDPLIESPVSSEAFEK